MSAPRDGGGRFRIASRGSALALWQAEHVAERLRVAHPGLAVEIEVIRTVGDRVTDVPLAQIGDKGLFTKEVDNVVLGGEADAAVHSLKDLPTRIEPGLRLGAVLPRADPRDVLLFADPSHRSLDDLPQGASVATSSLRRRAQLLAHRSDLRTPDIRGNVDTRLAAVRDGRHDALVLAAAGLIRLGLEDEIGAFLDPPEWLPAVGQGALAVTIADASSAAGDVVGALEHPDTLNSVTAERAFLRRLEGGCQVPIGALARVSEGALELRGLIASLDGSRIVRGERAGPVHEGAAIGKALAEALLAAGGREILAGVRASVAGAPGR